MPKIRKPREAEREHFERLLRTAHHNIRSLFHGMNHFADEYEPLLAAARFLELLMAVRGISPYKVRVKAADHWNTPLLQKRYRDKMQGAVDALEGLCSTKWEYIDGYPFDCTFMPCVTMAYRLLEWPATLLFSGEITFRHQGTVAMKRVRARKPKLVHVDVNGKQY